VLLITRDGLGGPGLYLWNGQNRAPVCTMSGSSNFQANFLLLSNLDANTQLPYDFLYLHGFLKQVLFLLMNLLIPLTSIEEADA
jgi:hypothetical protein